jgi:hypothetical protein
MLRNFSAFSTPRSETATVLCFSSGSKSKSAIHSFDLASSPSGFLPGSMILASWANL